MTASKRREEDRRLGMDRRISRRSFLQGMAVGLAAAGSGRAAEPDERARELRGQDVRSMELGHRVRHDDFRTFPTEVVDTGEDYDLVVVGAGLAGLAAAYVYRREKGASARVLLLENCDEFGGHARRNTFEWRGTKLIANGGTYDLENPAESPEAAKAILEELSIDPERVEAFRQPDFRKTFGLSPSVFFDPRIYPGGRGAWVNGFHETPYEQFFARAPLSATQRRELVELYTTRKNYLPEESDPEEVLGRMSWERFIREKMGLGDDAVRFANLYAMDLVGLGSDAISARAGYGVGPGFFGMGGDGFYERDGILRYGYEPVYRFPDGNHSIARHLLKKLLPDALSGSDSMEGVFNADLRYERFDRAESPVRLRLQSAVVRVEHEGVRDRAEKVLVHYVKPDGRVRRVTARGVVVAAWGMVAKHIVPELSFDQRRALEDYHYCSAIYINVLLRHWRPIAGIGAFEMYWPDGYCTWMHPSDPLRVGDYQPRYHPDQPTVLSMFKYLVKPGLAPVTQMNLGRYELETKSFEDFEREIRSELDVALGPSGFDPAEDILGITVNRWGHGYVLFDYTSDRKRPNLQGRERLGRISFAGADAGGTPWTQAALEQAARAAREQVEVT